MGKGSSSSFIRPARSLTRSDFRVNGKPKKLTLPKGISLAEARAEAAAAILKVERGHDPTATKKRAREAQRLAAANTFKAICESYLEREGKKKEGERLRSLAWRRALLERLVYPVLGDQPITTIKRKAIIDLLDKIEDRNGATMAHSTLAIVRKIMRWYAVRDEDYIVPIVPGMARIKPDDHARSRTLSDDELRRVWQTAEERNDPFAAMIQFMLLTAARRSEAAAMTWDEIIDDDIGPCWLLPASRNKVKVDLTRPLSSAVLAVLKARPRIEGCPYIFTYGRKPLAAFSQCKDAFDAASGVVDWRLSRPATDKRHIIVQGQRQLRSCRAVSRPFVGRRAENLPTGTISSHRRNLRSTHWPRWSSASCIRPLVMFADCGAEKTGSFTPKMMHAFLREVIKVGRPPAKGVPAIKRLALDLNRIQEDVGLWFVWRDRLVGKVDKAIQDLNKALPELLQPCDCEAKLPVDYSWTTRVPIPSKRYDDHVIFLRRLLAATQEARQCRERHLPFTPGLLAENAAERH